MPASGMAARLKEQGSGSEFATQKKNRTDDGNYWRDTDKVRGSRTEQFFVPF